MKTKLVRIGNSKGIRLPKSVIEQAELSDEVELYVADRQIIVRSAHVPRQGWEEAFKEMHQHSDDTPLDITVTETTQDWDDDEWTW
jgi:antitoxin MazE